MANAIYTTFIVSESPHRIEPADEETPTHYSSPEDAGKAITDGLHGEYGTRYVLSVALTPVAEYSRSWTLVRKTDDHEHTFSDFEIKPETECDHCPLTYAEYQRLGDTGHA